MSNKETQEYIKQLKKKNRWKSAKEYSDKEVAEYVERRKHDYRSREEIEDDERREKAKGKLILVLFAAGVLLLLAFSLKEIM